MSESIDEREYVLRVREIALREAIRRAGERPSISVLEIARSYERYLTRG